MKIPFHVDIVEVGPRDGFQNVKKFIETEDKIDIIKGIIDSGAKHIEITSFVHPKWVPQMADAKIVVQEIKSYSKGKEIELIGLVPNKFGATIAKELGIDTITYVISASSTHNMKNVNRSIEESFQELEEIMKDVGGMKVRLAIATTFGCPFGEEVTIERIIKMIKKALKLNCSKILLADTIGSANPLQVKKVLARVKEEAPVNLIGVHFHNTKGMGLANTLVALSEGVNYLESAIGGLGGCPFAPGAAGNIATEDLLNMLQSMNINTDFDFNRLMKTVEMVKEKVDAPLMSSMANYHIC